MRIFKDLFCLSLFPIGWMGGGRIRTFCRTKNICKKLKITFHPSTLGKVFDGSNQHRCRQKSALCRTFLQQASFSSDFITNGE